MERKKLRVDGIPTDIPAGRAKDKLTIHFLRSRNGGGEVENIDIIQGNPDYAIVTFEDDEVIQNVLRIKDHTLRVNDKTYKLVVSEVTGKVELEEVFQKLSLTLNYKKCPESCRSLLRNLPQTHKDVKLDFDEKAMTCIVSGPYALIQTLAQEILSKLDIRFTNLNQISSDTRSKTKSERLQDLSDPQDPPQVLEQRSVPIYGSAVETRRIQKAESFEQLLEPFVWDSDIFKYVQKFHSLEYQEIQNKYHVHAVDDSSDGITTIYLQTLSGGKNPLSDLKSARSRLMGLYQGLELLLRKEQIDKRDVYGEQDKRGLIRDLQRLYPTLLCHEDDRFLYLIGNGVDVAHGKQYISDIQLKYLDSQFRASGTSIMSEGVSHSLSPTYRHEGKVGSRIAASFNAPTTHSSYSTKSHIDERYLVSNSPSRQVLERERDLPNDKTSLISSMTHDLYKNEDFSLSQPDEKSEIKTMPSLKRRDVFPALKTGREELRHSRISTKPSGPLKPVRFNKASSELPYSSLVDMNSPSVDLKIPEGKLRRSNSLSRFNSKETALSEQQSDAQIFKDEIIMTNWLWHYIKQIHKSDIDSWCSEVVLTDEEKQSGTVTIQLKATNKSILTITKERLQLLYWKEDMNITSSCLDYATLGVQGPDDNVLVEWCDLFRKCSKTLSVKLEKDKLVIIYPKKIQAHVLEVYSQHSTRKTRSPSDATMPDDGQPSYLKDEFEFSGNNMAEDLMIDKLFNKPHLQPSSFYLGAEDMSQMKNSQAGKGLADQKYSLVSEADPFQGITHENKGFFDNLDPAYLDENSAHTRDSQDFYGDPKNSPTSKKPPMDFHSSKKHSENVLTDVKTYDHSSYTSEFSRQEINTSPLNVQNQTDLEPHYSDHDISTEGQIPQFPSSSSQLRIPAVGQESEITDCICVQCKNSGKTVQTSSGANLCLKCYAASVISALNDAANGRATLKATMTHTTMSLRLPGYERDTSLKIIYDVPDGVQGAGDPQPGGQYKGGRFEAYLPDNREGRKLLSLLPKALDAALIFHIKSTETGDRVTWYKIPHKTSPDGGKQKNGYPDLAYVKSTIALLKENGIE